MSQPAAELMQRAGTDLKHRVLGYGDAERRYLASCPAWVQDPLGDAQVSAMLTSCKMDEEPIAV